MSQRQITVIMLNFNGADHLEESLPTITDQDCPNTHVAVVDNGSVDNSAEVVSRYPVEWIGLGTNLGFAPAINRAVGLTGGDDLVFVNNDMRFPRDFVRHMVSPLTDHQVFAVDALQYSWKGQTLLHGAVRVERASLLARGGDALLPRLRFTQFQPSTVTDVPYACGGNMAVRRESFEALGGFNEKLVTSWEDIEICWRAGLKGWRSVINPAAYCWHRVGGTNKEGPGADYHLRGAIQGAMLFSLLHLPMADIATTWGRSATGLVLDAVTGRFHRSSVRARGIAAAVGAIPSSIRVRRKLYGTAGISPSAYLARQTQLGSALTVPAR